MCTLDETFPAEYGIRSRALCRYGGLVFVWTHVAAISSPLNSYFIAGLRQKIDFIAWCQNLQVHNNVVVWIKFRSATFGHHRQWSACFGQIGSAGVNSGLSH
jgi:hypothetical protein